MAFDAQALEDVIYDNVQALRENHQYELDYIIDLVTSAFNESKDDANGKY